MLYGTFEEVAADCNKYPELDEEFASAELIRSGAMIANWRPIEVSQNKAYELDIEVMLRGLNAAQFHSRFRRSPAEAKLRPQMPWDPRKSTPWTRGAPRP